MLFEQENFEAEFQGVKIRIQEHDIGKTKVFRVDFEDKRNPLSITRILTPNGKVWTSIPQGRSREAQLIGEIIVEQFKNK